MHRHPSALAAVTAMVLALLLGWSGAAGAVGLALPTPTGGGAQAADSPRPAPKGRVAAPDQVLKAGCHRYRVDYRVRVPGQEWSAEIFVKNPQGRGIHSFAIDSNATGVQKTGSKTYPVCRASTVYGVHRLRMKVTYCPDPECHEPVVDGFVTPGRFSFLRPRR